MIALIALAAAQAPAQAAPAPVDPSPEALFQSCAGLAKSAPDRALAAAEQWRTQGGGLLARQCLGLAYAAQERWAPAATAFEQAALEAEASRNGRRGDLWEQSGNSWLAAGDPAKARKAFDSALAAAELPPARRAAILLDRARAAVMQSDFAAARGDVDQSLVLVPADAFGWYLSAQIARRENKLARARTEIMRAVELAPNDADILLQAGNIAGLSGDIEGAKAFFGRAARAAPGSEAAKAAQAALVANSGPEPASAAEAPRS